MALYGLTVEFYSMIKYWNPVTTEEIKNDLTLTLVREYQFFALTGSKMSVLYGGCIFCVGVVLRCLVELAFGSRKSSA
jgi:hypothetical protein